MANDRVTQEAVEVLLTPTDLKGRTTQETAEVVLVVSPPGRLSQEVVEVLMFVPRYVPKVTIY